jgi:hypothetical protein
MSGYRDLPSDRIAVPSTGTPACVLTWIDRPAGGIRLYASRAIQSQDWGQRTADGSSAVDWHMGVIMREVLIVDRQTPAEAIRWVLERWAREDAASQPELSSGDSRRALP